MNLFKSLLAFLFVFVSTLFTASDAQAFALGNHVGGFFLGTLDHAEQNDLGTRDTCWENGWLSYDTTSGYCVATNNPTARRAYLNQKYGRTGDIDVDINARQQAQYDRLATQHINGSGKTQLGVFRGAKETYVQRANRKGHERSYFDIGFQWNEVRKADRWSLNERFLKAVTDAGDQIYFNIPRYKIGPQNKYSLMEIDYLTNKAGYKWINQWSLIKAD